jgi:hypothetical protein
MAEFNIELKSDNIVFCDGNAKYETLRILNDIQLKIIHEESEGTIFDFNGNRVGRWEFKD